MNKPARTLAGAACACLIASCLPAVAAEHAAWQIDPARTHIGFSIDATGFPRTQGEFQRFAGRLAVDFEHPALSRVNFRVEAQSIEVGSPSFEDTLRSEAFLNVTRFPEIIFTSTNVEKIGEGAARVVGDLTMLGVTRPLTVDVDVRRPPNDPSGRLGFSARAHIDRLAFGMSSGYPVISRDVDLTVTTEAIVR
jgi:polyisoprenoid-binding protein YceI